MDYQRTEPFLIDCIFSVLNNFFNTKIFTVMKKSFLTLTIVALIALATQSCETSSSLDEIVVNNEMSDQKATSAQDNTTKPGGGQP